jgi:hypothetical protein
MLALLRAATHTTLQDGYDQVAQILREVRTAAQGKGQRLCLLPSRIPRSHRFSQAQAVALGLDAPAHRESVRDVPLFLTDVATGAGSAIRTNNAAVQRRVLGLFTAALAACQLSKAGGLKLLRVAARRTLPLQPQAPPPGA